MVPMGTWFVATLLDGQKKGTYQQFDWAFAPAPQFDASTTGLDKTPVTFGDPTGLGVNAAVTDQDKFTVAKEFLRYAAGVEGGKALAGIGITPANTTDEVAAIYFGNGAPSDEKLAEAADYTFALWAQAGIRFDFRTHRMRIPTHLEDKFVCYSGSHEGR